MASLAYEFYENRNDTVVFTGAHEELGWSRQSVNMCLLHERMDRWPGSHSLGNSTPALSGSPAFFS